MASALAKPRAKPGLLLAVMLIAALGTVMAGVGGPAGATHQPEADGAQSTPGASTAQSLLGGITGLAPDALPDRSEAEWKRAAGVTKDPALGSAIRTALSIPTAGSWTSGVPGIEREFFAKPLTAERIATVSELTVPCSAKSLAGLESATGLTRLAICVGSPKLDLGPIAQLTIDTLTLSGPSLTDLSRLRATAVDTLFIESAPRLTDISPLASSPLKLIHINGTAVSDITALGRLARVEEISVSGSPITDLGPLRQLGSRGTIWRINLGDVPATDAQPLYDLDQALRTGGGPSTSLTTSGGHSLDWDAVIK